MRENMLWNSAGSITYLACQWLVTVLIVRLSNGYDAAGLLSLAMSVTGAFGTFANYKMGTYQISDIKHENTTSEYLGFRLITLGGSFVACIIYSLVTCPLSSLLTIVLYFLFKAVGLVIDILHGLDQLNRRMDFIGKSFMLQGFATLAAFVGIFWPTQSLDAAIIAMGIATLAVLFLYDLPHSRTFESFGIGITGKKALYLLKRSFSAVLASLACSAIFTVPKQLLLVMLGDAALGIYSSVAAPALVVQMGATYLYAPLLDVFSRHYAEGSKSEFLHLLWRTVGGVVLIGVLCFIVMTILRLPYTLLISLIVGITNMIPYFGGTYWRMGTLPSVRGEHTPLRLPPAARGRRLNRHGLLVVLRRPSRFAAQLQRVLRRQHRRPGGRAAPGHCLHQSLGHERR